MAKEKKIYQYCIKCKGTGKIPTIVRYENEVPVKDE